MKFTKNLLMLLMLPAFALPVIAQDSEDEDEGPHLHLQNLGL